ncbi:MAG: RNA polymerase sigma factor [Flammeovirgaceae bacterium]
MHPSFTVHTIIPIKWLLIYVTLLNEVQHFLHLLNHIWLSQAQTKFHQTKEQMDAEYRIIAKSQKNPNYFGPIYQKYYDSIFIFINRRLDDEEETADVTSIVFYKCLQNIGKFKFQGVPFSAWLFRIAINEVNQFFRRKKEHMRAVSLKDHHVEELFEEMAEETQLDKHVVITKLLEQLSPEDIQFLELRFFEGYSFRDMGYFLGLTEVNAKIKTYRIVKKLKKYAQEMKFH